MGSIRGLVLRAREDLEEASHKLSSIIPDSPNFKEDKHKTERDLSRFFKSEQAAEKVLGLINNGDLEKLEEAKRICEQEEGLNDEEWDEVLTDFVEIKKDEVGQIVIDLREKTKKVDSQLEAILGSKQESIVNRTKKTVSKNHGETPSIDVIEEEIESMRSEVDKGREILDPVFGPAQRTSKWSKYHDELEFLDQDLLDIKDELEDAEEKLEFARREVDSDS